MAKGLDPGQKGRNRSRYGSEVIRRRWVVRAPALVVTAGLGSVACGQVENALTSTMAAEPNRTGEVVAIEHRPASTGPDTPPQIKLALRDEGGNLSPIAGLYLDAVDFREGMAAVSTHRELRLVHSDGSMSVLVREVDGLPVRASDGSLLYAARFGEVVEIHRLTSEGKNRRLASFRGSATRLTPRDDGTVVFVGSEIGGVAGVWIVDSCGVRCLTNCELSTGKPWGDAYLAPPGDTATVRITGGRVEWQTAEGVSKSAPIEVCR